MAIVIASLIVLLLATVASSVLNSYTGTTNSMIALRSASAAMDLVASDLGSLSVFRQPAATTIAGSVLVAPGYVEYLQAKPETAAFDGVKPIRMMLTCYSAQDSYAASSGPGPNYYLPRFVCYRIVYQDPLNAATGTSPIFGLYRQVASTSATSQTLISSITGTGSTLLTYWTAKAPTSSNFIAGNITDLEVVAYANLYNNGVTVQPAAPVYNSALDSTATGLEIKSNSPNGGYTGYGPILYLEVTMVFLEQNGAVLWGTGTGTGGTSPATLKQLYGHTLTRKVELRTN